MVEGLYTYYCEVPTSICTPEFTAGVTMIPFRKEFMTKIRRCMSYSDRVWLQGPHGGIKLIKDKAGTAPGYITKNEEFMKQFMWAKLQAQPLANYT